ncbi:MAG: hypothetical protein ACUVQ7_02175 [bacterium]
MKIIQVIRSERGAGLVLAILAIVALFALGATLAFLTRTEMSISKLESNYVHALYVAEAGVEEALYRLALANPTMISVNGGNINAAIADVTSPYDPNWRTRIFLCRPSEVPTAPSGETYTATIQDASSWLEYSTSDDPDLAVVIEHKWRDLNGNGVREIGEIVLYDGSRHPPENLTSGSPIEVITVTGRHAGAQRKIVVEAVRFPLSANVRAGLLCDKGVDVRGNVTICGHNHSISTPQYTDLPECRNYELCSNRTNCLSTGCLTGIMTTGDIIDKRGSTDLAGYPTPEDSSSSNQFLTLAQTLGLTEAELQDLLSQANYHNVGVANPQDGITYVDNPGSEVKWTNGSGSGLLYIKGSLKASGNFIWRGLVYVEGDFRMTGTVWILGAVVVKGESEWAFSGGNPAILYSRDAISYYLSQHLEYKRIGWKEISGL